MKTNAKQYIWWSLDVSGSITEYLAGDQECWLFTRTISSSGDNKWNFLDYATSPTDRHWVCSVEAIAHSKDCVNLTTDYKVYQSYEEFAAEWFEVLLH